MKVTSLSTTGLSMTFFVLTVTSSVHAVWAGSPFFQLANQKRFGSSSGKAAHPLVRKARNVHVGHMPCVFLPQLSGIKTRFEQWMDKNQDGRADFAEVKAFLQTIKDNVSDDVITSYIKRRDDNGNGDIDLVPEYIREFVEDDYGMEAATEWFYLQDSDDDGLVTKPELVHLGVALGMSEDQAEETALGYYLPYDTNADGVLNFQEFSQLYQIPSA